jgi:ABC-2 type transport system permease protein
VDGYVDPAGLVKEMPPDIPSSWLTSFRDETAAQKALEAGKLDGYYLIPADYVETGDVTYVTLEHNPIDDNVDIGAIEWVLLYNIFGDDADLAATVWNPVNSQPRHLASAESEEERGGVLNELLPNIMTLLLYMVILISASVLVQAVTDEKKNRVLEVVMSSISTNNLISGKILGVAFLGLLMMGAWVGLMYGVYRFGGRPLNIPISFEFPTQLLVWAGVFGFTGYMMYGSLMAGLGAMAPDIKDARGATMLIMSPFILAYMFMIVIIENPNGIVSLILSYFPLTSPIIMITRMTSTDLPLWEPILALLLQLIAIVAIMRMVARLFRAKIMLSGQPFTVKSFFGVLFGRA